MNRLFSAYPLKNYTVFKSQVLQYLKHCSTFCFLDSHDYRFDSAYECLVAVGVHQRVSCSGPSASFGELDGLHAVNKDWIFGHLAYDLKNCVEEGLHSSRPDLIGFEDLHFFIPKTVLILSSETVKIGVLPGQEPADLVFSQIISQPLPDTPGSGEACFFQARCSREEYLSCVHLLKEHLQKGDCYEINFCQEFFAHHRISCPVTVFQKLCDCSPSPFSAFYRNGDQFLLSASPERFLKRSGNALLSQPIKGTAPRIAGDTQADLESRAALSNCPKERAENTMTVDLVRNDLSRVCTEGSVRVRDFLQVFSFAQVHQMISSVEGMLPSGTPAGKVLEATFPMGSMTGAPKRRVMELIEAYEKTKRGLFSGSVGYMDPEGNFDFNVVIRSILYNSRLPYVSVQCGSAITIQSDPEKEYEECLLKAGALFRALS